LEVSERFCKEQKSILSELKRELSEEQNADFLLREQLEAEISELKSRIAERDSLNTTHSATVSQWPIELETVRAFAAALETKPTASEGVN
jgi:septal ring factor EnvC (AmiA/AmiB activator)